MATPAHRFIQDQNSSILYAGTTPGAKNDVKKPDKKTVLGGRKALNDISNARKPFVNHSTKKEISTNVVSIGKDPVASKAQLSKPLEKGKSRNRKALTDLTNSIKPSSDLPHGSSKAAQKSNIIAGKDKLPSSVAVEGFLHNHQECVKAQRKAVDVDYFLESVGLQNDMRPSHKTPLNASSDKGVPQEAVMIKFEEITEQPFDEDQRSQCLMSAHLGDNSAICLSPQSPPKSPQYSMNWDNDDLSDLTVIDSPTLLHP